MPNYQCSSIPKEKPVGALGDHKEGWRTINLYFHLRGESIQLGWSGSLEHWRTKKIYILH